ncbi:MAG: DUF3037 domain-containing protein [Terriglobia bacterium]
MPDTERTCRYFLLRYTPNIVRGEFINLGVFLYDPAAPRLESRLLDDFRRLRRLHPWADLDLLARLSEQFEQESFAPAGSLDAYIERLQNYSNLLEFSAPKGVLTANFDAELDRLYDTYVREPRYPTRLATLVEGSRAWIRARLNAVLRTAGLLGHPHLERRLRVAPYTQPGDPFAFDFGYRTNSTRGFFHALALARELDAAKILAYTAERVRARLVAEKLSAEFTAIVESLPTGAGAQVGEPSATAHLAARILAEQHIALVPVAQLPNFAQRLRQELA